MALKKRGAFKGTSWGWAESSRFGPGREAMEYAAVREEAAGVPADGEPFDYGIGLDMMGRDFDPAAAPVLGMTAAKEAGPSGESREPNLGLHFKSAGKHPDDPGANGY